MRRSAGADAPAEVSVSREGEAVRLSIRGAVPDAIPAALDAALAQCAEHAGPVWLDLGEVDCFGPAFAGRLVQLERMLAAGGRPLRLAGASPGARQLLRWNGLDSLLERSGVAHAGAT
jgi:N-acetylglucosaminyldiphosphoundecaprenol N-acetyl-beta-D-mannosaminyltransferase